VTAAPIPTSVAGRSALDVARAVAADAGAIAIERFRQPQDVAVKGRGNLVSETDFELERFITRALLEAFPDHHVLSEETATDTDTAGWVWVVDPLDGTRNFVSGIPVFCVNIALCHNGEPVVAVTHDPNQRETFWAERGGGAFVNDRPARVSDKPDVASSVLGVDLGYDDGRGRAVLGLVHRLFPGMQSVRIPGSAALGLAYAACGRYDLFLHHMLYPWDLAPAILLVREAGGTITDVHGRAISIASQTVLAGGAPAHADFLRWQREHRSELDLPP